MDQHQFAVLREYIEQSQRIFVLTGAGMSTASGIPDFRSAGGVWSDSDLLSAMSDDYLKRQPETFWSKFKSVFMRPEYIQAEPNQGHRALRSFELTGKEVNIFTQNVDGLHSKAGSQSVFEMHGTIRTATCPACGSSYDLDYILRDEVPRCDWVNMKGAECGHVLHPDTVLFGQPIRHYDTAMRNILLCDLVLVLGTSLTVEPVASLPLYAKRDRTKVVLINLEDTYLSAAADLTIRADIADVLKQTANALSYPVE